MRHPPNPNTSYVWSPVYIDAMIARDRDANGQSADGLEERLYAQHDANFNITALLNTSGTVVERIVSDPYGTATFLNASWTALSGSAYGWVYTHQSGRMDTTASQIAFRERNVRPSIGRWERIDPTGFRAGDTNFYRYIGNRPTVFADPSGLDYPPSGVLTLGEKKWLEREECREAFMKACKDNNVDPKMCQRMIDTAVWIIKPIFAWNPCKLWAEVCLKKFPAQAPSGQIIGAPKGCRADMHAWVQESCAANLWCALVDSHFAVRIKFPDGQTFYFDDGDWGHCFQEDRIPVQQERPARFVETHLLKPHNKSILDRVVQALGPQKDFPNCP